MMAPSNSVPRPVLMVVGEKAFQIMVSQMLVAMNSEIPEPRPYLATQRQDGHPPREDSRRSCDDSVRNAACSQVKTQPAHKLAPAI